MDYPQSIKSLLQSRIDNDDAKFYSIAMQVAAHEAKLGHGEIALELRSLIDKAKAKVTSIISTQHNAFFQPHSDFIDTSHQKMKLTDLSVLCPTITDSLNRLLKEYRTVTEITDEILRCIIIYARVCLVDRKQHKKVYNTWNY